VLARNFLVKTLTSPLSSDSILRFHTFALRFSTMRTQSLVQFILAAISIPSNVQAGFDPSSKSNIAIYWGQNSAGQQSTQTRLSHYCNSRVIIFIFTVLSILTPHSIRPGRGCPHHILPPALQWTGKPTDNELCQPRRQMLNVPGD
jgi:hypothetical protein